MKKQILLALLAVTLMAPAIAQDLEDTIEDELGRSSADSSEGSEEEEDLILEDLDEEEEKAATPPAKTAAPTKPAAEEESEDEDVADVEDEIESEETEETAAAAPTPAPAQASKPAAAPKSGKPSKDIYAETLTDFDDQASPQFEARIYEIFSKRKQVEEEQWTGLVGRNSSGVYKVQRGDTLWDISQTFFGDGNFWPKLWSENSVLTNPHEIRVGKAIAFIAGTEESAPAVSITDVKAAKSGELLDLSAEPSSPVYPEDPEAQLTDDDIAAGTVLEEQPIVGGRPELPEPLIAKRPVLKNLPPSFVEPVPPKSASVFDSTGLDVGRRKAFESSGSLLITSYLSDGKPDSIGAVSEIVATEQTAAYLQDIIVTMNRVANAGEKFSVFMPRGKVTTSKTKTYGPVVDIGGLIEIRETVNEAKRIYRATVVTSVGPIEIGALISEVPLPKAEFSFRGPRVDLEAVVLGGSYSNQRSVLGTGAVVYIDKGSKNGLSEGQLLAVRSDRALRRDTKHPDYSRPIGVIKLARVLERVSTAVVISASEPITQGDLTGGQFPKPAEPVGVMRAQNRAIEIRDRDVEEYKEEMTSGETADDEMDEEF